MPLVSDYELLWDGAPGTYLWSEDVVTGGRTLLLAVPDIVHGQSATLVRIYVEHAADNWAVSGPAHGWDGNIEEPTLSPSIQVMTGVDGKAVPGWHGWLQHGELRSA